MADDTVILTKRDDIPAKAASSSDDSDGKTIDDMVDQKVAEEEAVKAADIGMFEKQIDELQVPARGDQLTGKLLEATKNAVYVDLGQYGVGVVRGRELWDSLEDFTKMDTGTEITSTVLDSDNEDGMVEMSFRKASKSEVWEDLKKKMDDGDSLTVKIRSANKGGLMTVVQGISAFLPVSQLTPEHYPRVEGGDSGAILERLQQFIGSKFEVRIITAEPEENKLIISEKEVEFAKQRDLLSKVPIGTRVKGTVSGVVDFGIFVKFALPGKEDHTVEGLVHLSELSWKRINDPEEIVKQGEEIEVEIIGVDDTKISLSYKRLQEDPWKESVKRYKVGQVVEGEVTKVAPFGAFVRLDDEVHGLLHISEIVSDDDEEKVTNAHNHVHEGDKDKFKIISIDPEEHRLGLSQKALKEKRQSEEDILSEVSDDELAEKEEEMKKARLEKFAAARAVADEEKKDAKKEKKASKKEPEEKEDKEEEKK